MIIITCQNEDEIGPVIDTMHKRFDCQNLYRNTDGEQVLVYELRDDKGTGTLDGRPRN